MYFHSRSETTAVHGSERTYGHCLCSNISLALLNINIWYNDIIKLLDKDHYINQTLHNNMSFREPYILKQEVVRQLETAIKVGYEEKILVLNDKPINTWNLLLNTALLVGSDTIKLLVRLHSQCEIHAFIRGKNREWFADIIKKGRSEEVLREKAGWEETVKMLRSNNKETVVTSYSVCSLFPNDEIADWEVPYDKEYDEPDWDKWYDLSEKKRWHLGLRGIIKKYGTSTEFCPETWNDIKFGDEMTVFDLHKKLIEKRRENELV